MNIYQLDRDLRPSALAGSLNVRSDNGALLVDAAAAHNGQTLLRTEDGNGVLGLEANPNRKGAFLHNASARDCYVSVGQSCRQSGGAAFVIPAGVGYEFPFRYTGRFWVYTGTAGDQINVTEVS